MRFPLLSALAITTLCALARGESLPCCGPGAPPASDRLAGPAYDQLCLFQRSAGVVEGEAPLGPEPIAALLQRAGYDQTVDDAALAERRASLASLSSPVVDSQRVSESPAQLGFLVLTCATVVCVVIICACSGLYPWFDLTRGTHSAEEDRARPAQAKIPRHGRPREAAPPSESDNSSERKSAASRCARNAGHTPAPTVGGGSSIYSSCYAPAYNVGYSVARPVVQEKRQWPPPPLYAGPLPEGECVFLLRLNTLFRRDRGERTLSEASGKLNFRAATLGTEGWPLVVFVGAARMPTATIGPALQDTPVAGPGSLELRGGDGSHYGVLDVQGANKYVVSCGGYPLLRVEGAGGVSGRRLRHLAIASGDGVPAGEVRSVVEGEPRREPGGAAEGAAASTSPELELRIFEGTDPVLVMISVLTVLLFGQGTSPSGSAGSVVARTMSTRAGM